MKKRSLTREMRRHRATVARRRLWKARGRHLPTFVLTITEATSPEERREVERHQDTIRACGFGAVTVVVQGACKALGCSDASETESGWCRFHAEHWGEP